jgi:hypothetical protein
VKYADFSKSSGRECFYRYNGTWSEKNEAIAELLTLDCRIRLSQSRIPEFQMAPGIREKISVNVPSR